jgi:cobalt-precorrin-5B (C1)-methyltransferase
MIDNKPLKKGYTTGVHTSFAFKSALECFISTNFLSISKTNKMDNDDLDVTKGCEIIVSISNNKTDLIINNIKHQPYILKSKNNICEIYAGNGVGIVTKDGLKPPKKHPAINPIPLQNLDNIFQKIKKKI